MTTYKLNSFVLFIFFSFSLFLHQSYSIEEQTSDDINWWCSTTPHPEPCKYLMADVSPQRYKPKCKQEFRTMTTEVALEQALQVQKHAKNVGQHCRGKRKKLVWMDCDKLIDDTILQLNRTLHGIQSNFTSCSDFDAQTWLSASLTNIETCLSSSNQLNVSNVLHPTLSTNVSQLISNCLAINGELVDSQNSTQVDGFPSWVTARERKLLQSTTRSLASKAIYVVAQDGSGNFRSVQAAINAASKKVANQRTIIYIKKGVYRENVAIGPGISKIMLVGAGLRYTIITGSRSAAGGFTTYSTATVGTSPMSLHFNFFYFLTFLRFWVKNI